jgi:hypothetical protein
MEKFREERKMKTAAVALFLLLLASTAHAQGPSPLKQENATLAVASVAAPNAPASNQQFKFERGQRVYVVAVNTRSRNLDRTKSDLEVERYARDQFKHSKVFVISNTLRGADFVFLVLIDSASSGPDGLALAALPDDYVKYGSNLDALRNAALWQSSGHVNELAHAELGVFTFGGSILFDHPNLAKGLVKTFQKETISK